MEKRPKNPIKIVFFKVVIQKWKNEKNGFFSLQKLPDTICVRKEKNAHFRAHYLLWPKHLLDQNIQNQEKL